MMKSLTEYGELVFSLSNNLDEWGRKQINRLLEDGTNIIYLLKLSSLQIGYSIDVLLRSGLVTPFSTELLLTQKITEKTERVEKIQSIEILDSLREEIEIKSKEES